MLFVIGVSKSTKVLIGTFLAFVIVFFGIGQARERILGAFNLDETSQARIQSWENALIIFKDHPVFGVGFNNYRTSETADFSFPLAHHVSGPDNSYLFILATTGILGAAAFGWFGYRLVRVLRRDSWFLASVGAVAMHALFNNSWFYNFIMLWMVAITAEGLVTRERKFVKLKGGNGR